MMKWYVGYTELDDYDRILVIVPEDSDADFNTEGHLTFSETGSLIKWILIHEENYKRSNSSSQRN
jgi:hypothetical protein